MIEQANAFIAAIEIQIDALRKVREAMGRLESELRAASVEAGASHRAPRVERAERPEHGGRSAPTEATLKTYQRDVERAREKGRPAAEIAKLEKRLAKALAKAEAEPVTVEPAPEPEPVPVSATIEPAVAATVEPVVETAPEPVAHGREVEAVMRTSRRRGAEAAPLDASKLKALGAEQVETTPSGEAAVVVSTTPRRGRKIVEV